MKKQNEDKVDWVDKHSEASMMLFNIVGEIRSLARAFNTTGNRIMGADLVTIAKDIEKANKDIRDAIRESISEFIKRCEENSKAVVEAALAGAFIERELTK